MPNDHYTDYDGITHSRPLVERVDVGVIQNETAIEMIKMPEFW